MQQDDAATASKGTAMSDGRRLSWEAAGVGGPAVVLEAGLSGSSAGWSQVINELAQVTRVIAYDRAGYGSSDPVEPAPEQVVQDVLAVLHDAGVDEPVILVGHSWGGVLARLFAAAYPERVAALVLLDATHEDLPGAGSRLLRALNLGGARLLSRRARAGHVRRDLLAGKGRLARIAELVPPEHRPALVEHLSVPSTWEQTVREATSVPVFLRAVRYAATPGAAVTAVIGGGSGKAREARTRQQLRTLYETWLGPENVTVIPGAGHMLPLEAPQAVARQVADVVAALRHA